MSVISSIFRPCPLLSLCALNMFPFWSVVLVSMNAFVRTIFISELAGTPYSEDLFLMAFFNFSSMFTWSSGISWVIKK
jgi:hypothetical protein